MKPLALLALLLVASACADEPGVVTVDRVHDFIALLPRAEITGDSPYVLGQLAYVDTKHDDRDAIAYLRAPPGTTFTYHDLATGGPSVLSFACGIAWREQPPRLGGVVFRVEARNEAATQGGYVTVFEQEIEPGSLPEPDLRLPFRVDLPDAGSTGWSLRFSTELASGLDRKRDWPGWFSPVLRSEGRVVPLDERPVARRGVAVDLVATLDGATVLEQQPEDPVRLEAMDAVVGVGVHGGRRLVIAATASSRVRYTLDVGDRAELAFAVGMDTERGWSLPGDGMTFAIEIAGERIWERTLEAPSVKLDRGWKPVSLDLSPWAGTVDVDLVTEPGADTANDVGGWANVRLLEQTDTARRAAGDGPNVLLIVIDTLRADSLGCYGAPGDPTPRLDTLARDGVLFADARSVSSFTWPATGTILTGLYPHGHGVVGRQHAFLTDGVDTLAELFSRAGYSTGAFIANPIVGAATNFHQGFESFVNVPSARGRALNQRVLFWTENQEGSALLAYVHYFDPHDPYAPPAGFELSPGTENDAPGLDEVSLAHLRAIHGDGDWTAERIEEASRDVAAQRRAYEAEVRYIDGVVGELLDDWEQAGLLEDALVVVASDHGEEFYEHGRPYHGTQLYEESLRVPLWVTGFGRSALDPDRIDTPVSLRDLLPTLLESTGVEPPGYPLPGFSLLHARGDDPLYAHTRDEGADLVSAVLHPWKLIRAPDSGRVELYDLAADPRESTNLADAHPDVSDRMRASIDAWLDASIASGPRPQGAISEEMRWWLEELGYVGR